MLRPKVLTSHVRHQGVLASALDSGRNLALVLGAKAGAAARSDLLVRRDEPGEHTDIFVVDDQFLVDAETAGTDFLFFGVHN